MCPLHISLFFVQSPVNIEKSAQKFEANRRNLKTITSYQLYQCYYKSTSINFVLADLTERKRCSIFTQEVVLIRDFFVALLTS